VPTICCFSVLYAIAAPAESPSANAAANPIPFMMTSPGWRHPILKIITGAHSGKARDVWPLPGAACFC
jgi:hypothetical protein